jgi:REP element-mobilizing transposase RayT
MVRSISDVPLFKDDADKDKYLYYVQKYQKKLGFKVYAYCLMTTHGHFIIDANGADISKVMHGINQCYAQYFNFRHKRHGHVFQDRFKSKVVDSEGYLFTLSAYIHNNPTDIEGYETCPEMFKYSTLGIYLGLKHDEYEITDESFVMGFFSRDVKKAREEYYKFVMVCDDVSKKAHYDFKDEKSQYRSERAVLVRDFKPKEIITRQDMLVLTERALRSLKKISRTGTMNDLERFTDRTQLAEYSVNSIAALVKEGLIGGSEGRFDIGSDTTRAEAAVFLYRIYNK